MLIKELREHPELLDFIADRCCDEKEELRVDFSGEIPAEDYLIIKPDEFYASLNLGTATPKSPDCFIVQRCAEGNFHIYLIEFKNFSKRRSSLKDEIFAKFETCLHDFMSDRFREQFYNLDYAFKIHPILILANMNDRKIRNFKFDFLLALPPLKFGSKRYAIRGEEPHPMINSC